jgi:hypothetical protein
MSVMNFVFIKNLQMHKFQFPVIYLHLLFPFQFKILQQMENVDDVLH